MPRPLCWLVMWPSAPKECYEDNEDGKLYRVWQFCKRQSKSVEVFYRNMDEQKVLTKIHFPFNPDVSWFSLSLSHSLSLSLLHMVMSACLCPARAERGGDRESQVEHQQRLARGQATRLPWVDEGCQKGHCSQRKWCMLTSWDVCLPVTLWRWYFTRDIVEMILHVCLEIDVSFLTTGKAPEFHPNQDHDRFSVSWHNC